MNQANAHKVGLVFGGMLAIWHAVWAIMVLVGVAKPFLDWILGLHFLNLQYSISSFSFGKAILLVIVTAIFGYIVGYLLGWFWNLAHGTAHRQ